MRKVKTKYTLRSDGRIEATKTINGKRKHFYGKSDEEIEAQIELALHPELHPVTAKEIAEVWWEKKEPTLSVNSVRGYKCAVGRFCERFGDEPIKDITSQDIFSYLSEMAAKDFSQKVIADTKCIFKMIFDEAFIQGEIQSNPATYLPPVKGKKKQPRQAATDLDKKAIEENCGKSLLATMMYFMLLTGARKGEAVALQEKDINRKTKTARISKSCAWDGPYPVIKEPKTAAGERTVLLPDKLLQVLPKYKDKETYIFFPNGLPNRTPLDKAIRAYQEEFHITSTPHQLRHSYASMLHSAGVDVKDAQHLLGHSTVVLTQDIYTHLEDEHKKAVADQINAFLNSKKNRKSSKKEAK